MSNIPAITPQASAAIDNEDATVKQMRAADPYSSAWVGASAGTGKTKVLTDRVLRLLLPREDDSEGTAPHRILGITYTKAAANEMALRINETLGEWATHSEEQLEKELTKLTGHKPSPHMMREARSLFASVVDTPGGMKIMTIHSFCQSVLSRFPIEAGISPHSKVIEEVHAQELLTRARDRILGYENPEINEAVKLIAQQINEEQFMTLINDMMSERQSLHHAITNPQELYNKLCRTLELKHGTTLKSIQSEFSNDQNFAIGDLYECCKALAQGGKTDKESAINIQYWLDADAEKRTEFEAEYINSFLTKTDRKVKSRLATKAAVTALPDIVDIMTREALRVQAYLDDKNKVTTALLTKALLTIGKSILDTYTAIKEQIAALDYDDLIIKTNELLSRDGISAWVMYKLDGGLDHILIDEAQDTNSEQWQIINNLAQDFFSGQSKADEYTERTLFVVGDEKQSIYSFQRAAPEKFAEMRQFFEQKIKNSNKKWTDESLNTSFRSTKSVLELVDTIFAGHKALSGLGKSPIQHISFRTRAKGQAGLCELWPLFEPEVAEAEEPWTPPITIRDSLSAESRLASLIGDQIKNWLDTQEILESRGRPIEPRDILILVKSRNRFVEQIVRALKTRDIPLSGVDRMILSDELSIMDLTALAQFALLPDDDLTLATILKSPLIGFNEEQLYDLAIDRQGSLWKEIILRHQNDPALQDVHSYLDKLVRNAQSQHPFDFFSTILFTPCPADKISGKRAMISRLGQDIEDPIDEFLGQCLNFEHEHTPDLQSFLLFHRQNTSALKRELEDSGNVVRIMTVHGAKGLQAPIVIMPDTILSSGANRSPRLLWPHKTGLDMPLWSPRNDDAPQIFSEAQSKLDNASIEEYRRLLYVALTRAEDRLYIGGAAGKKSAHEDSWYNHIARAFDEIGHCTEHPLEFTTSEHSENSDPLIAKRIYNMATKDPDKADKQSTSQITIQDVPAFYFNAAPEEPTPPRPLIPSRPSEVNPPVRSPLAGDDNYRFIRGNITHSLLQYLPDIAEDKRRTAASHYTEKNGQELPEHVRNNIIDEVLSILSDPELGIIFSEKSLAEVPITGLIGNKLISAQIDRMIITDNEIMIVDFKSNRPPPQNATDIPDIYKNQMLSYRDIVSNIYKDKTIRLFLLWTDGANLMELTDI